jgi:hypothetical protein
MDVLGFKDAFKLITEAKIEKMQEQEMIDKSAFKRSVLVDDYNENKTFIGIPNNSNAFVKRNPNAKQMTLEW